MAAQNSRTFTLHSKPVEGSVTYVSGPGIQIVDHTHSKQHPVQDFINSLEDASVKIASRI